GADGVEDRGVDGRVPAAQLAEHGDRGAANFARVVLPGEANELVGGDLHDVLRPTRGCRYPTRRNETGPRGSFTRANYRVRDEVPAPRRSCRLGTPSRRPRQPPGSPPQCTRPGR